MPIDQVQNISLNDDLRLIALIAQVKLPEPSLQVYLMAKAPWPFEIIRLNHAMGAGRVDATVIGDQTVSFAGDLTGNKVRAVTGAFQQFLPDGSTANRRVSAGATLTITLSNILSVSEDYVVQIDVRRLPVNV